MTTAKTSETATQAPVTRDAVLDSASAADKARADRDAEKRQLITELSILADRKDAIEQLAKEKKERLEYLVRADSDRIITTPAGTADWRPYREVRVADAKTAAEKLDPLTMAEYLKPTAGLADALTAAKVALSSVGLEVEEGERLTVSRPQDRKSKELRADAIERTKAETEATIARILARMSTKT
jgi:hypothetical protein